MTRFEQTEIPRRRNPNGSPGGPYVIPPNSTRSWGDHECATCGRMVQSRKSNPRKGACKCVYYRRATTFIKVISDDYLLNAYAKRNVVYGMSQREDLVLLASTCRPDSDREQSSDDQRILNTVAADAEKAANDKAKATIGTSLHRITQIMDEGGTIGAVPARWVDDVKAYDELITREKIEWVAIEQFRVHDEFKVAGTADRIGFYRGRYCVFDTKTGDLFDNCCSPAMQEALYAHMIPYDIATDTRIPDAYPVDQQLGWVIHLKEGSGQAVLVPMNLTAGWGACTIAKKVWQARSQSYIVPDVSIRDAMTYDTAIFRASSTDELRDLWDKAKKQCCLTAEMKDKIRCRAKELAETRND